MTENKGTVTKAMHSIKITFLGGRDPFKIRMRLANFRKKNIVNNVTVVSSESHV